MVDSYLTFEPSFWELQDNTLFESTDKVVVLGKEFNKRAGLEPLKKYVTSRFWFTYRRNFAPIGELSLGKSQSSLHFLTLLNIVINEIFLECPGHVIGMN
ncbi:hypothetical protein COOONC_25271 [Cooperia oncophora]